MDYREGSPKPKRQRKQLSSVLNDSEIEEALYSDNSEDDYQPDDEESASESESEEHLWNIECRPPTRPSVLPTVQEQDLQPFTLTVSDSQGQGQAQINQPSASGSTSEWTTTGEMKEIRFTKSNEFYGEVEGANPIDYFNFFFTEDFLTMICTETNAQAQRLIAKHNQEVPGRRSKDFARITGWKPVTVCELRIFLGLLFHMGTIPLSRLQDYRKTDRLFSIPIFGQQM
ncbi:jg6067, partial [Pararge aegeria aegeria]